MAFRAAASSLLNECGKWNANAIEAPLAHAEVNSVRKAYARAEYWAERVEMMVYWANRLDELRRGGSVWPRFDSGRHRGRHEFRADRIFDLFFYDPVDFGIGLRIQ